MLPKFPNFKKLDINDREHVELITKDLPEYSDFNFTSLWCWDVNGEMMISELNNNLVVKFNDYLTSEQFLSLYGTNEIKNTASQLFKFAKESGLPETLKLVPEFTAELLLSNGFKSEEDRDNFDYIYDLQKLSKYEGSEFSTKRSEISRFLRDHNHIEVRKLDLLNTKNKSNILKVNYAWLENKMAKDPYFDIRNELIAIERFLNMDNQHLLALGIFSNGNLIAYSVNEITGADYATGHFYKTYKFFGLFDLLMQESAKFLLKNNVNFLNFEQDLGISGLRQSKLSYHPHKYLKKHFIKPC